MGLDMYLTQHIGVKNWEWDKDGGRWEVTVQRGGKPVGIKTDQIETLVLEKAYWRKANAIHRWFVEHVQEGKDDCEEYWVSRDHLAELLRLVEQVLADADKAPELLPTQSGFFFGTTTYDEWYMEDMRATQKQLSALLSEDKLGSYYYRASW